MWPDLGSLCLLLQTAASLVFDHFREHLPVPVINPGLVMYKLCEVFLELGLTHSKHAFPAPQVLKDDEIFSRLRAAGEK